MDDLRWLITFAQQNRSNNWMKNRTLYGSQRKVFYTRLNLWYVHWSRSNYTFILRTLINLTRVEILKTRVAGVIVQTVSDGLDSKIKRPDQICYSATLMCSRGDPRSSKLSAGADSRYMTVAFKKENHIFLLLKARSSAKDYTSCL